MIQDLMVPKDKLLLIPETLNCLEALTILEEYNLRNAPVVDPTEQLYRGNIYKYHIYKQAFHVNKDDLKQRSVTTFLKNTTHVIHINDSIYQLLFAIRDLPYIAVLNEKNNFIGVVYHDHLLDYLAQAWGAGKNHRMIQIKLPDDKKAYGKLTRYLSRFPEPKTIQLYQPTDYQTHSFVFLVFGPKTNTVHINGLILKLRQRRYDVREFFW